MSEVQVASRYAKSLIDLAKEQKVLDSIKDDIELFLKTCRVTPVLRAVLKNPIISPSKKIAILKDVFKDILHSLIFSFFAIVIKKGRSGILYSTAKEFINEYNIYNNITTARVTSAVALSEENKKKMIDIVKNVTKGDVILTENINPQLIGGFVLNVGDKQIDTTILSQLQKVKKEFSKKW